MADNRPSEGPQHRRNRLVAVRSLIPVVVGAAIALALPAGAAAAPTIPGVSVPDVAVTPPGPYPAPTGLVTTAVGGVNLGWHGGPPPVIKLPDVATITPGPYPKSSGLVSSAGGVSLGWHGRPPTGAAAKRAVARAHHRRH